MCQVTVTRLSNHFESCQVKKVASLLTEPLSPRAYPGVQPPARASAGPPPRRGARNALGPPSRAHPAWYTAAGLLVSRPPATSFGDPARHPDTGSKDREHKRGH